MLNDMGILADSVRYYHDADAFTATNLYHVPHAGSYHCDKHTVCSAIILISARCLL